MLLNEHGKREFYLPALKCTCFLTDLNQLQFLDQWEARCESTPTTP